MNHERLTVILLEKLFERTSVALIFREKNHRGALFH